MSKVEFKAEDFGHVTDGLLARIEGVIADRKRNTLSSSAIYKAHNELFKLREPIQTCQSCLVIRGDKLAKWYEWNAKQAAAKGGIQMPVTNAGVEGDPNPAQSTYDLEDGRVLTVHADGGIQIDGVPAMDDAAYKLKDGTDIAVFEGALITNAEGDEEPLTYAGVAAKYNIVSEGMNAQGELEALAAAMDLDEGIALTDEERAVLQARYAELFPIPVIEVGTAQTEAAQILLQKIDKDDFTKTEGDPFYAAFTASEADTNKGKVVEIETGKAVKPGTYATEIKGSVLSVSVGGAANYKAV